MSENLKKVLEQFAVEGLDGDWHAKHQAALAELEELEEDARFLNALRRAGVDNWDGYDYAIDDMAKE
jgi:hypothetical protein